MKRSQQFAAACLAAGLATAGAMPASAVDYLTLDATPTLNLTDAYFLYGNYSQSGPSFIYGTSATFLGNLTGGVDNSFNIAAPTPAGNPADTRGTLIGLYNTRNGFITLGFQSYNAGLLTTNPESFANSMATTYTESQLATALQTGDTTTLDNFYANDRVMAIGGLSVGQSGGLIDFSISTPSGLFSLSSTPEPGTMALLGLGAMALFCVKRSRRVID
jgi:PEP-CTERM motif